jgi:hypothetical protein
MEEEFRHKDDLIASKIRLMSSWVEIRGKLRGYLEYGSAQSSLSCPHVTYLFPVFAQSVIVL